MALTRRGRAVVVLAIVLGGAVVAVAAGTIYLSSLGLLGDSDPHGRARLRIPEGASASTVGRILERHGVVRSATGWRLSLFMNAGEEEIQAGDYVVRKGLTPDDALAALLKGPEVEFVTVTFPEGSWLTEMAEAVGKRTHIPRAAFIDVATSGKVRSRLQPEGVETLEGLMFPSTYQVVESDTAARLARRVVGELEERMGRLDLSTARRLGAKPYEVVTIASMVEAETRVDAERPKVARVIYNRLAEGMALGIDATVIYALGKRTDTLTESDLAIDSPYNTRVVAGLPPTPIGAPGQASLEAAAQPADGRWLYYVLTDCSGTHSFSESYEEFLDNKAIYEGLDC